MGKSEPCSSFVIGVSATSLPSSLDDLLKVEPAKWKQTGGEKYLEQSREQEDHFYLWHRVVACLETFCKAVLLTAPLTSRMWSAKL